MRTSKPANQLEVKKVCNNFPNIAILTKSATPSNVQLTFTHASVGNKSLGGSVAAFALTGSLDSTSVIFINVNIAFTMDGDKIRLPFAEGIHRAASGDLARSRKQRDWTPLNAVLLPPFLTEVTILDGETSVEELLKIFARSITERADEKEYDDGDKEDDTDEEEEEAEEETNKNTE